MKAAQKGKCQKQPTAWPPPGRWILWHLSVKDDSAHDAGVRILCGRVNPGSWLGVSVLGQAQVLALAAEVANGAGFLSIFGAGFGQKCSGWEELLEKSKIISPGKWFEGSAFKSSFQYRHF